MKQIGKEVMCDYPGCAEHVLLKAKHVKPIDEWTQQPLTYESLPEGWGAVGDKDLCPDHYQAYLDMMSEFWNPVDPNGKHSEELRDEDILHTNMPGIKVTSPKGTVDAHQKGEEW